MDKILEKLGIYDLMVLLLTGMIILLITIKIFPIFNFHIKIDADDSLQFLIISYFIGMVFQELGSKFSGRKLLKPVFKVSNDLHISLSQKEIDFITNTVCDKLDIVFTDDSVSEIYNYCKSCYIKSNRTTIEIDKQQSVGGMARSLSIYFVLIFLISVIKFLICINSTYFFMTIISCFMAYIFYNRYVRFFKMRYVLILRAFYYENNR